MGTAEGSTPPSEVPLERTLVVTAAALVGVTSGAPVGEAFVRVVTISDEGRPIITSPRKVPLAGMVDVKPAAPARTAVVRVT